MELVLQSDQFDISLRSLGPEQATYSSRNSKKGHFEEAGGEFSSLLHVFHAQALALFASSLIHSQRSGRLSSPSEVERR